MGEAARAALSDRCGGKDGVEGVAAREDEADEEALRARSAFNVAVRRWSAASRAGRTTEFSAVTSWGLDGRVLDGVLSACCGVGAGGGVGLDGSPAAKSRWDIGDAVTPVDED